MSAPRELRIEQLLGRKVHGPGGRKVGRIEEIRARRHGTGCVSTELVIGTLGLLERLDVGTKMLLGGSTGGCIVKWDQIDVSDPENPRLLVAATDLERIDRTPG
jgi:sporulation protein YlmC with PRC-barrel domain